MNIKHFIQSGAVKKIIYGIIILILLLVVFQLGEFVGFKKAEFSDRIGADYFRQLSGRNDPSFGIRNTDFENTHGTIGRIISIALPNIVVEDHDGLDKTVHLSTTTEIRNTNNIVKPADLTTNDTVVVFGAADSNAIVNAQLVRILPEVAPGQATSSINK